MFPWGSIINNNIRWIIHITAVLIDLGIISCNSHDLAGACWENYIKEQWKLNFTCTVNLINLDIA